MPTWHTLPISVPFYALAIFGAVPSRTATTEELQRHLDTTPDGYSLRDVEKIYGLLIDAEVEGEDNRLITATSWYSVDAPLRLFTGEDPEEVLFEANTWSRRVVESIRREIERREKADEPAAA